MKVKYFIIAMATAVLMSVPAQAYHFEESYKSGELHQGLVVDIPEINGDNTWDNMLNAWSYMGDKHLVDYDIALDKELTSAEGLDFISNIALEAGKSAFSRFPETLRFWDKMYATSQLHDYDYNLDKGKPVITLHLGELHENSEENLRKQREFNRMCENIIIDLYNRGELRDDMSIKDKAKVLFTWTANNITYDYTYTNRNGYETLVSRTGVCSGYTSIYNKLCHLVGIPVEGCEGYGISNGTKGAHIWSKITIEENGKQVDYYIDSTWGDYNPDVRGKVDYTYFWKTWDQFLNHIMKDGYKE